MNPVLLPRWVEERETWLALGVSFGVPVGDLLQTAWLPLGWSLAALDSTTSFVLDQHGRRRGRSVHRETRWERTALLKAPLGRFVVERDFSADVPPGFVRAVVTDAGRVVFATDLEPVETSAAWEVGQRHERQATLWLDAQYPQHRDPLAYWEISPPDGEISQRSPGTPLGVDQGI